MQYDGSICDRSKHRLAAGLRRAAIVVVLGLGLFSERATLGNAAPGTGPGCDVVSFDQSTELDDRELITAFLAVSGLVALAVKHRTITSLPQGGWLVAAYVALALGCIFTLVETFFLPDLFNLMEHSSYLASTVLLAVYCWRAGSRGEVALS